MVWTNFGDYFTVGAAGAAALEVVRVYEERGKLSTRKWSAQFRSPAYWIVLFALLVASGKAARTGV